MVHLMIVLQAFDCVLALVRGSTAITSLAQPLATRLVSLTAQWSCGSIVVDAAIHVVSVVHFLINAISRQDYASDVGSQEGDELYYL